MKTVGSKSRCRLTYMIPATDPLIREFKLETEGKKVYFKLMFNGDAQVYELSLLTPLTSP